MNEALIANWNNKVGPQDSIFLLGDVSFAKPPQTETVLKRLNGNIYLIKGNHDWSISSLSKYFAWVKDLSEIEVPDLGCKNGFQTIVLCHFPFLIWDKKHYGSWMLHGHCHGNLQRDHSQLRLDVGVDCHNFMPISYQEVKAILSPQTMYMD